MKKIALLTINSPLNYGAILQMFALNYYLRLQGYASEVIKYTYFKGYDNRNLLRKIYSKVWKYIRWLLKDSSRIYKTQQFKNKIVFTQLFQTPQALKKIENCYDAYIVGSDQVWNPRFAGEDINWCLAFTSRYKIAYAASFGIRELPAKYIRLYYPYIQALQAVSVREESGAKIIEQMGLKSPMVVMDPVFLLTKEQWHALGVPSKQKNYILCYYMPGFALVEQEMRRIAQFYSKKYKLTILNIGKKEYSRFFFWENNLRGIGPSEFLGLIENAELVITNSFHGTAFSVLFDKKFISVVNTSLGKGDLSSRIVDLLTRIGHTSAIVDVAKEKHNMRIESLSSHAKQRLSQEITKSKEFLRNQLEGQHD